ncbi:ATP-dependent DNA helicase Mph1p [[Candida] anglica]|uniref:ATP-dependent DNA helicase n=1 Tax=[Candida] anglica TaxID=148631 RepID=A0ABP0EI93_9ASCO
MDSLIGGDDDDGVFDDNLDTDAIDNLLSKTPVNQSSVTVSGPPPPQRNLYGEIVATPSDYIDIREELARQPKTFPPTHHFIDYDSLDTYLYPTNFEVRDYQYNIVRNAFYNNILVALPTGLGKTFIASTVMLNFHRWFPESKIIFMAPTRPLVAQQIQACCRDTGIPASHVATLLDKTKRNRAEIWDSKSIFFTTPQVVENDLTAGLVDPKSIVLLVVDEAHRAKGNYAYNNVVKFLDRFTNSYRILTLTATPASDVEGVQEIIDNLSISKVEVRTENSIDTSKYLKRKVIERITVTNTVEIEDIIELLSVAIAPVLKQANERKIYDITDPSKINAFKAMEASQRMIRNPSIPEGLKWSNYFLLQLLNVVGQALRRLVVYGIRSFYSYFNDKFKEFTTKFNNKKSKNQTAASFFFHDNIKQLLDICETWLVDKKFLGHSKLESVLFELDGFFQQAREDSGVIIFTEFRESALEIVRALENSGNDKFRPHIFIGQAKEKEKFDEVKFLSKGKKGKKKKKNDKEEAEVEEEVEGNIRTSSEDAQAKGMNQKMQKELIQKFKRGEYNILVATSIGEEGLDIGEVDLIVCYDSTGSPIKNIQRMGRTGRKRDGKVLLLFASNEESKFDKAMGGYEYIQQHIMNNKLIQLSQSDRIIPKQYTPIVKRVFIEIPEENKPLTTVDDEDEIIRLATQYMKNIGPKSKNKSKKKAATKPQAGQSKLEKRFFMPDNVETGFTKAANLVRNPNTSISSDKDILDSICESEDDSEDNEKEEVYSDRNLDGNVHTTPPSSVGRSVNTKSHEILDDENNVENLSPSVTKKYAPVPTKRPVSEMVKPVRKTLGLKRARPNIIEQVKEQASRIIKPQTTNEYISLIDDEEEANVEKETKVEEKDTIIERRNEVSSNFKNINIEDVTFSEEEDVFDDGLDEELVMLGGRGTSSTPGPEEEEKEEKERLISSTPEEHSSTPQAIDEVFKSEFEPHEGFLNEEEQIQLYTRHYTTVSDMSTYYDPIMGAKNGVIGKIGHSTTGQNFVDLTSKMAKMTKKEATEILNRYKNS